MKNDNMHEMSERDGIEITHVTLLKWSMITKNRNDDRISGWRREQQQTSQMTWELFNLKGEIVCENERGSSKSKPIELNLTRELV